MKIIKVIIFTLGILLFISTLGYAYAKKIAKLDRGLNHSTTTKDGENLYMSYSSSGNEVTFSNHPFKDASLSWYREKKTIATLGLGKNPILEPLATILK